MLTHTSDYLSAAFYFVSPFHYPLSSSAKLMSENSSYENTRTAFDNNT